MNDRDPALGALLDRWIPRHPDVGDWAAVTERASRKRRWRTARILVPGVAVAALAAVMAVVFLEVGDDTAPPASESAGVGILDRPQTERDRLPPDFPSDWPLDPSSTRLAQSPDGGDLYVSRARDGKLCVGRDHPRYVFNMCDTPARLLGNGAIGVAVDDPTGDRYDLWGLVGDGVTQARAGGVTVPIVGNTYWIDSPKRDTPLELLTASGWHEVGRRVDAHYAILSRPRTPADSVEGILPPTRATSSREPEGDPLLHEARFAIERAGVRYYVTPADNGNICLVAVHSGFPIVPGSQSDASCRNRETLTRVDALMLNSDRAKATIVPDGFTAVTTGTGAVAITGNVMALESSSELAGIVTLTGPAGQSTIDLGPAPPPSPPLEDGFGGGVSEIRTLSETRSPDGRITARWRTGTRPAGVIQWLDLDGLLWTIRCSKDGTPALAPEAASGVVQRLRRDGRDYLIVSGFSGRSVATLTLTFDDGARVDVPVSESTFVRFLDIQHSRPGRGLVSVTPSPGSGAQFQSTTATKVTVGNAAEGSYFSEFAPAGAGPDNTPTPCP